MRGLRAPKTWRSISSDDETATVDDGLDVQRLVDHDDETATVDDDLDERRRLIDDSGQHDDDDLDEQRRRLTDDNGQHNDDEQHDDDDELRYQWAAVLINDALNTRSQSLARERTLADLSRSVNSEQPASSHDKAVEEAGLHWFWVAHNRWLRRGMFVVIFVLLLAGFFESPARGVAGLLPAGLTQLVEFVCLLLIGFDVFAKVMWMGPRYFLRDRWNAAKLAVLALYLVDLLVALPFLLVNAYALRVSRFLRVFFLVEKSRRLRKMLQHVGTSVLSVATLLLFIAFVLVVWSFLGLLLFDTTPVGAAYFRSFAASFVSLFILLTTANFPDIMMAVYERHQLYGLYFVAFLLFVLYFLLNALTAIVYNAYRAATQKEVSRGLATRRRALTTAFHQLSDAAHPPSIGVDAWLRTMRYVRPDLSRYVAAVIFYMVARRDRIELADFLNVCDFVDLDIRVVHHHHHQEEQLHHHHQEEQLHHPTASSSLSFTRTVQLCRRLAASRYCRGLLNVMLLANAALAIAETYACAPEQSLCSPYVYVELAFVAYFWLDAAVRCCAAGGALDYLAASGWHVFDVLTLGGWSVGLALVLAVSAPIKTFRWVLLLQTLRLLRLLDTNREFQMVTTTFYSLLPSMAYYLALLFCIYYDYALLGCELFYGVLDRHNPVLAYTTYGQFDYWANNFNSMAAAFVVLFEQMVVNNWWLTMEAVVTVTNPWSRLYFMSFFLVTAVIVLNLVVAFVIEAFVVSRDQLTAAASLQQRLDHLLESAQRRTPGEDQELLVRPSTRLFQLWAQLYRPAAQDFTHRTVSSQSATNRTPVEAPDEFSPLLVSSTPLPSSSSLSQPSSAVHPLHINQPTQSAADEIPPSPASRQQLARTVVDYIRQQPEPEHPSQVRT